MISPAFRYNAGLIRANGTPFFTGDGSTSTATLLDRHGHPIISSKLKSVDAIHRTDWQGRQLLYPTARTNFLKSSNTPGSVGWNTTNVIFGTTTVTDPSGGVLAQEIIESTTSGLHMVSQSPATAVVGGSVYELSICVAPAARKFIHMRLGGVSGGDGGAMYDLTALTATPNRAGVSASIQAVPNGFFICRVQTTANSSGITTFYVMGSLDGTYSGANPTAYAGDGSTVGFRLFGAQLSQGSGGYIPTTSAGQATVTDYTLSGSTVNFGEVPDAGATCDWTGVARR